MTTPLTWDDLRGRRVGVWGVGVEGTASLRRLRALGTEPVLVDRAARTLDDGSPVLGWDAGGEAALATAAVVVKSPGISAYGADHRALRAAGPVLTSGLALWLNGADRSRVLCVTGTKGKSTTTSIAHRLLTGAGEDCAIGGNIGACPWDPLVAPAAWWVVEVSSYQAVDLVRGPRTVAVTSIGQDHLPWHGGSVENYQRDKLSLCTRPGVERVVANGADPELRRLAGLLGPHVEWVEDAAGAWAGGALIGEHNLRNAEIARRAVASLGVAGMNDEALLAASMRDFAGLPHRLRVVAEIGGTTFVDDSISTAVSSTVAAVRSFPGRRIALLVGGQERGIDYAPLAEIGRHGGVRVFTMPGNGPHVAAALRASGFAAVEDRDSLEDAVAAAHAWAGDGGIVLLSPAAASFDRFADYRARGDAFLAAAEQLTARRQQSTRGR